ARDRDLDGRRDGKSVGDEVVDHLTEAFGRAANADTPPAPARDPGPVPEALVEHPVDVYGLRMHATRVRTRQHEQSLDEAAEPLGLCERRRRLVRVEILQPQAERGQRG